MVKSSILFALILGVIFAPLISAYTFESDSDTENSSDDESPREKEDSEAESDDDTEAESPALSCLLFKDLGCNTECSTTAGAFSIKGTGKCTAENICQCELEQDQSLEGLFRAKFDNAEGALKKIKQDNKLAAQVLEILRVPFQTTDQTKRQLRKVVYPAIYDQLIIDDTTPAWELGLVDEIDELDYDKIKEYVNEKVKSTLKSSSKQLTSVDYKSELKKSLESKNKHDVRSIINEVRRTKNKNLIDIVDDYLKSNKIKEKNTTEDIADAISYQIVDQFVNHIETQKKLAEKRRKSRRSSTKNTGKKSTPIVKKSPKSKSDRRMAQ